MPAEELIIFDSLLTVSYHSQLAEQYGNDVASEVMARSRSNLQLDAMPTMPYTTGTPYNNRFENAANK